MKFSLVICTYKRAMPLLTLLDSVQRQTRYPNEILIVDGSPDGYTEQALAKKTYESLFYHKVAPEDRGLTRQRNYGIDRVASDTEIICFLDDDTVLEPDYFEAILNVYKEYPEALGVGGYIVNETAWLPVGENYQPKTNEFVYDGWKRKDGSRFAARKKLGLDSNVPPGFAPEYSHGRSIGFLPPSGKVYETQQLMGGVSSFRKDVFGRLRFSTYFEGYGLYEDADFTLRLSNTGKLYVNTNAKLAHYHDASGRPNAYRYGKMVVRNGWYVWRAKYPKPSVEARMKWHSITLLLTLIRLSNVFTSKDKKQAFMESLGRTMGWWSLIFYKPKA
ncbi:glycosyltransferase family 2 protein [Flavobacterium sp. WW92]|uniref:glycosyltransferase family 2 protein n=1 Tax=unclassified Flavobacterium TaxID=196869 RepID=UPI002224A405|nr:MULTISPECIES: glycosyltransferase family A protein [unclassified Flavobacterium]WDO14511.1 glycosyltransferase family 2 protein [Flavobacterium sp. WW92]